METYFGNIEHAHSDLARERVLADLKVLARDTEALLKATAGDLSDKTSQARSRVTAALERAKSTCIELQTQAVSTAKAAAQKTNSVIRDHPYESIGVAFGLGLLFGLLVNRK
jgi:ElaB/YqjD/DUF883 family membrane-anchored ribosome-binding protein